MDAPPPRPGIEFRNKFWTPTVCAALASVLAVVGPAMIGGVAGAFDIQGHRGARGLVPENTLAGFNHALSLGATTLEMDIGVTRDGHLVISHDPRLNPAITRGPDGNWLQAPLPPIHSLSLEQLGAYDVGRLDPSSRYARRFPEQRPMDGERIPTLAQALALAPRAGGDPVHLNIETKLSPLEPGLTPSPEAFAKAVVEEVRAAGAAGRVTVQSFDWRTLGHVQKIAPELRTAYLTAQQGWLDNVQAGRPGASPWTADLDIDEFGGSIPRLIHAAGGDVWSPYFRELDSAQVIEAKALGLRVIVWTVNEVPDMNNVINLGVDGIITDYPDRLREILRQRGLVPFAGQKGG